MGVPVSEASVTVGGVVVSVAHGDDGWTYDLIGRFDGRVLMINGAFSPPEGMSADGALSGLVTALSQITPDNTGLAGQWVDKNRETLRKGLDGQEG